MRTFFGLMGIGVVFAALCGAALSWNGSVYLFQILDTQSPFVAQYRFINIHLHLPVLLVSNFTSNIIVLQTVFGLVYAAIPVIALALSWWIIRDRARFLFVWAAFGIGFGTLPGQFYFIAEANVTLQLFWPVLLAILTRMQRSHMAVVGVLIVAIFLTRPYAVVLFACAALAAFAMGVCVTPDRRKMWSWASIFSMLMMLSIFRFWLFGSSNETEQVPLNSVRWSFDVAVAGFPLLALVCAGFTALSLFAAPLTKQHQHRRFSQGMHSLQCISIVVAGMLLLVWASNPEQWIWANKFTIWALFVSMVFMSIAALESLMPSFLTQRTAAYDWKQRTQITQAVGAVFALVLVTQSTAWLGETKKLRAMIDQSAWSCVSMAPVKWLEKRPLLDFGTPRCC